MNVIRWIVAAAAIGLILASASCVYLATHCTELGCRPLFSQAKAT